MLKKVLAVTSKFDLKLSWQNIDSAATSSLSFQPKPIDIASFVFTPKLKEDELLAKIKNAYDSGDYNTVLTKTNTYINSPLPTLKAKLNLLFYRGLTYLALNRYNDALSDFSSALNINLDNKVLRSNLLHNRALIYLSLANIFYAAHDFLLAVNLNPKLTQAFLAQKLNNTDSNLEQAAQARLADQPNSIEPYVLLALSMLANNEKKFPAVLSMLNQAIKQDKIPVAKTEIASLINAYQ